MMPRIRPNPWADVPTVVFTLFLMMDRYHDVWSSVAGSRPVPEVGEVVAAEPEAFDIDVARMMAIFREGFSHFSGFWKDVLQRENFEALRALHQSDDGHFLLPPDLWARVVYDFSATFHSWERHRRQLVDTMSPLYYARVASFVTTVRHMSDREAEAVVEAQAEEFENRKPYLVGRWELATSR